MNLHVRVYDKVASNRAYVELPVYSKYLVIAAYIASFNPVKSDKRFFSKVDTTLEIIASAALFSGMF